MEGLLTVTGFDCTNPDEKIQEFIGKYRELYNTDPNDCSSRGYDTIYCVADAYKNGAAKENLAEWMLEKTDYQGVTCDIRFDGNCDNQSAITYIPVSYTHLILGQLNFAHGDVYAVGCFVTYSMFVSGMNPIFALSLIHI